MSRFIFDLETNGLLEEVSTIHCGVMKNIDTGVVWDFKPTEIGALLDNLHNATHLVGQNSIKFDNPVIEKLYPQWWTKATQEDTLVMSRLIYPDIKTGDFPRFRRNPEVFPSKYIGSHSLGAWGRRLGNYKGDYTGGWDQWSMSMHEYMIQDSEVTLSLYNHLLSKNPSPQSMLLEHRVAWLCAQIERNGFPFDTVAAGALYARLSNERDAIRRELTGLFPSWTVALPDFIPKRPNKSLGYQTGVPVPRSKVVEFNPSSRAHIADRLINKYEWKPRAFNEGTKDLAGNVVKAGAPKIDEEVLSKLPYPEAKSLARYFVVEKRIGQLAEGNQAWLKLERGGKIHASYNTNGAVTGRSTHSHPNISQVPRVSSPFGRECRALFHVPKGWVLIGTDQSGLELRCLASDMSSFDNGAYATVVTQGDVHTTNQKAAGLPTRDLAKTFIYAFLYGAGFLKIGQIAGGGVGLGKRLTEAFLAKTPALKKLIRKVKTAAEKGWIKGIDGREMPIRNTHAALNTRLQNSGAVICKQWICDFDDAAKASGLKHGWSGDYAILSWSHDEMQIAVRDNPETIALIEALAKDTGRKAGDPYNFKCPLDVSVTRGLNWSETH